MDYKKKAILMATALFYLNFSMVAQDIRLKMSNVSVKQAMSELKDKSGFSFVFSSGDINTAKQVSVNAKQLNEAIRQILDGQQVTYEIQGKNIIVRKLTISDKEQAKKLRKVSGIVLDVQGEPVIGANVVVKNDKNIGTVTDLDGKFTLDIPDNANLEISYIGYISQLLPTKGKSHFIINLKEDAQALDEVVVVGYLTQKKGLTTGAVSSMKVDEKAKTIPTTSAGNILVGKLAGVNVGTANAIPGTAPDISIRTGASWNSESVTFVIDGVVRGSGDFNNLTSVRHKIRQ